MLRDSWRAYRKGVAQNFKDVDHIPKCGIGLMLIIIESKD